MALRQSTPKLLHKGTPQLQVVPPPAEPATRHRDGLGEEFLFANGSLSRSSAPAARGFRPGTLVRVVLLIALLLTLFVVVRSLTSSNAAPRPVHTAAPAPASAAPAPPVVVSAPGVPMAVVSSVLSPTAGGYHVVVTVRNPTDVTADDVTVTVTLRDAAGRAVVTQTRRFDTLSSGKTEVVTIDGELDPAPAGLEVSAVAARLEARA